MENVCNKHGSTDTLDRLLNYFESKPVEWGKNDFVESVNNRNQYSFEFVVVNSMKHDCNQSDSSGVQGIMVA